MHALYLFSVWLHILAATAWIGGMFFLVLVVVPWLRRSPSADAGAFLRETGLRFRGVGWACFGILALTGAFNLWTRGVRPYDFVDGDWLASPFGHSVVAKLGLFGIVLALSAVHDFVVGPQATAALAQDPRSAQTRLWRRRASWLGRANVLLALALVAVAVTLVRGWP